MTDWQPTASISLIKTRAQLLRDIREYFSGRDVLEVETPLLSQSGNTDPEIQSIRTTGRQYLRTSPEFPMKRLLASGSGDIYELGRVFRAGESGSNHNPEFTMLEWYRLGFGYHQLMDEVADLVKTCGQGVFDQWPEKRLTYLELFEQHLNINPFEADAGTMAAVAAQYGITDIELNRRQWLDLLISHIIQPALPKHALTFVYDFPADQAALAKVTTDTPPVAQRFELYLGRTELANGYQELIDAAEQQHRFDIENAARLSRGEPMNQVDNHLVAALQSGLADCAGVALGVDRLLMAIGQVKSIKEVIAFPQSRA
jgi:lysyl-tRNA synthetase class 2